MTTKELRQQIEKVLGNNIRCLLPSYWWKRLFHQVADRIDEVEQKMDNLPDGIPIVSSIAELDSLNLNKGRVASVVGGMGFSQCYQPTDEELSSTLAELYPKLTRVKGIELKNNPLEEGEAGIAYLVGVEGTKTSALQIACIKQDGLTLMMAAGNIHGQTVEILLSPSTIAGLNKILAENDIRFLTANPDGIVEEGTEASLAALDKKFAINIDSDVYVKGHTWERLLKEGEVVENEENEETIFSVVIYTHERLSDAETQHNIKAYQDIVAAYMELKPINILCHYNSALINASAYGVRQGVILIEFGGAIIFEGYEEDVALRYPIVALLESGTATMSKANHLLVNSELSSGSSFPVQNKVITAALAKKQDELQSGVNIKTVNGQSILGEGDISAGGFREFHIGDNLTDEQKAWNLETAQMAMQGNASVIFNLGELIQNNVTGINIILPLFCMAESYGLYSFLFKFDNVETSPAYWEGTNMYTVSIEQDGSAHINTYTLTPDTAMSDSSLNVVQNKVIKEYVDSRINEILTRLDNAGI